jgi:hypothetical protein
MKFKIGALIHIKIDYIKIINMIYKRNVTYLKLKYYLKPSYFCR